MFEPFSLPSENNDPQSSHTNASLNTELRLMEAAMEIDESLVLYGSPTLLGLKCASAFTCPYTIKSPEELHGLEPKVMFRSEFEVELASLASRLADYGVLFDVLAWRNHGALLMVYRPLQLRAALQDPLAKERLQGLGYTTDSPEAAISLLKERLREFDTLTRPRDFWDFPHEIGHFLGYPATDVEAYTRNRARGFHCQSRQGAWFTYGDKEHMATCAERFRILNAAVSFAADQHRQGTSLEALAAMGHLVEGAC